MWWKKTNQINIPKDNAQEVTELESWTVSWRVSSSLRWSTTEVFNKVFIKKSDAEEFKKQLIKSAEFINTPIETELKTN